MPPDPLIGSLHSLKTPPIQNPGYAPASSPGQCVHVDSNCVSTSPVTDVDFLNWSSSGIGRIGSLARQTSAADYPSVPCNFTPKV